MCVGMVSMSTQELLPFEDSTIIPPLPRSPESQLNAVTIDPVNLSDALGPPEFSRLFVASRRQPRERLERSRTPRGDRFAFETTPAERQSVLEISQKLRVIERDRNNATSNLSRFSEREEMLNEQKEALMKQLHELENSLTEVSSNKRKFSQMVEAAEKTAAELQAQQETILMQFEVASHEEGMEVDDEEKDGQSSDEQEGEEEEQAGGSEHPDGRSTGRFRGDAG